MKLHVTLGLTVLTALASSTAFAELPKIFRGQSPAPARQVSAPAAAEAYCPPGAAGAAYGGGYGAGPVLGTAPGYGERRHHANHPHHHHDFRWYHGVRNSNFGYEGGQYGGTEAYYHPDYPQDNPLYATGPGGGPYTPHDSHLGHHGHPHHYHTQRYRNYNNNWVYPQGPLPAGQVAYPYYTVRGPTDFFMK